MTKPADVVLSFLEMWKVPGGFRRSIETYFCDGSVYENIGMSKTTGLEETLAFVQWYDDLTGGGWMVAETHALAVAGNTVLTERVDHMVDGKGTIFLTTRVMGAFDVEGDKILAWRDYFDTTAIPAYEGPGRLVKSET